MFRVIFDRRLTWMPQLKHFKNVIKSALNINKILTRTTRGGETQTLIKINKNEMKTKSWIDIIQTNIHLKFKIDKLYKSL